MRKRFRGNVPGDFEHFPKPLEALRIEGHAVVEPWCVRSARSVATILRVPSLPLASERQLWLRTRDRIGWKIPESCVFGSLIEFGFDLPFEYRCKPWYYFAIGRDDRWLIVEGPFRTPVDADYQAQLWIEHSTTRLCTFPPPDITDRSIFG